MFIYLKLTINMSVNYKELHETKPRQEYDTKVVID